jgi:hypothetical protein
MQRVKVYSVLVLALVPAVAAAQSTMASAAKELERAGFGFYDLSVFGGYTNSSTPSVNSSGTLIPDYSFHSVMTGVSASLGWRARKSESLHLNIRYTPSYYYQDSSTGFHASNFRPSQSLNLSWGKTLATRWNLGASLSATAGDYNQLLLLSNPEQVLTGVPGTAGELAGAVLVGNGGNGNLNAAATDASALIAGQQQLLYGNTFFSASAGVTVGYLMNPRTSFSVGVSASRMEHLPDSSGAQVNYILQQSTSIGVSIGANHQLTPRTSINANISYNRSLSSLYTVPSASIMVGAGRTFTEHFFGHGAVGAGYLLPSSQGITSTGLQRTQWQASAGLGYRLLRQSFVGSVSRTVADAFGVGGTAMLQASAGWTFHPLTSSWALTAGAGRVELQGTQVARTGYRVSVGVNRRFRERAFVSLSYGYGYGSGQYLLAPGTYSSNSYHNTGQSVRLSIGWRPYLGAPDIRPPLPGGTPPAIP